MNRQYHVLAVGKTPVVGIAARRPYFILCIIMYMYIINKLGELSLMYKPEKKGIIVPNPTTVCPDQLSFPNIPECRAPDIDLQHVTSGDSNQCHILEERAHPEGLHYFDSSSLQFV